VIEKRAHLCDCISSVLGRISLSLLDIIYKIISRWQHQDGSIKMAASRWQHQDDSIKMAASRWQHQDDSSTIEISQ
jgi:hypothetical protein